MGYIESVRSCDPALFIVMDNPDSSTDHRYGYLSGITRTHNSPTPWTSQGHWSFTGNEWVRFDGIPARSNKQPQTWAFWVRLNWSSGPSVTKIPFRRLGTASATAGLDPRFQFGVDTSIWAFGSFNDLNFYDSTKNTTYPELWDGNWHYIVIQRGAPGRTGADFNDPKIIPIVWIDGKLTCRMQEHTSIQTAVGPLIFGWNGLTKTQYDFQGDMRSMEYYERLLSSDEIAMNYEAAQSEFTVDEQAVNVVGLMENEAVSNVNVSTLPHTQRYYYNIDPLISMLDAGQDTIGTAADTAFKAWYGLTRLDVATAGTVITGFTTETVDRQSDDYRRTLRGVYDSIARWPQALITPIALEVTLCSNLLKGTTPVQGVVPIDGKRIYIDIEAMPDSYYRTDGGAMFVMQHELQHVFWFKYQDHFINMQSTFESMNPVPYVGGSWVGDTLSERPLGYVREYGKTSYIEDIADIHAMLTTPTPENALPEWLRDDPILRHKVRTYIDCVNKIGNNWLMTDNLFRGMRE